MVEAAQNCEMSLIDLDICHRIAITDVVLRLTLTLIFKVKYFLVVHLQ